MAKKDFSVRVEVETMAGEMGVELTPEQVDDVVNAIEEYDTFLSVVSLFVTKGIKEVAERDGVAFDETAIEEKLNKDRQGINQDDF